MKFSVKTVSSQPEILKRRLGGELFAAVTVAEGAFSNGVVKAGTPLDADGAIANSAAAVGILLNDVYAENPNGSLIKGFATINKAVAENNAGITYDEAAIEALANIIFE